MFQSPVDIGNRAIQHIGSVRMDPVLGFNDTSSRAASEIASCYDGLRRAELQRAYWKCAIRKAVIRAIDTGTMLLVPALWSSTTTYFIGSIVSDSRGVPWRSIIPNNLGNDPQSTRAWEQYCGPLTVQPYDSTLAYSLGELVYVAPGDGTSRVFVSLIEGNSDNPVTATAWDSTVTYRKNQVVTYLATAYMSLIDLNTNQTPSASPAAWNSGTTYGSGAHVYGSDGVIYTSNAGGNTGNDPTLDLGVHWTSTGTLAAWTTSFVGGAGSVNWLEIGGSEFPSGVTLTTLVMGYPAGAGPLSQSFTRNAYLLPAGYLRMAPQDPKAGAISYLGAPGNLLSNDWTPQDRFLVTSDAGPIPLRFVADLVDVTAMADMFCEGLGARIGFEICETVTQSTEKQKVCAGAYEKFMKEAREVDAIEQGPVEPPLDDWLACRF